MLPKDEAHSHPWLTPEQQQQQQRLEKELADWHASPEAQVSPWPQDKLQLANMVMGFHTQRVNLLGDTLLQRSHDYADSVGPSPAQVSPCSPGLQPGVEAQEHMETSEVPSVPSAPTSPAEIDADEKEPVNKRGRSTQV